MLDSFGARLRQRREEQHVALAAIAQQTKIKSSLFDELERDDVSHWPAGIFRRAFIRAYAQAIGLNPDVVVREFLEIYPEPVEVIEPALAVASAADGARISAEPPTGLRARVISAMGSLFRRRRGSAAADAVVAGVAPVNQPASSDADFLAVAQLCTEFGRVESASQVQPLLREAAGILRATGLVVWVWNELVAELTPALAHGYTDKVLAHMPTVRRDADNATAAAFRSAQTYALSGSQHACGALVVPLLTLAGCAGVLAIELPHGAEQTASVRAAATIFAALLAPVVSGARRTRPCQEGGSGEI